MCQCKLWKLSVFLVCFCVYSVKTFNVDSFNYALYDGQDSSMFGFSIALHKEGNNGWLIVGAPEAQSSYQRRVHRGGVVYKCPINRDGNCQEIPFDTKDHIYDQQTGQQHDNKTEQWFGATVSSSGRPEGPIVACAPRYTWYPMKFTRRDPVGTCYVSNGLFNQFNEYSPCRTYQWGYHRQGSCQAGFSAAINSVGDRLFIGAPGSWYWQGQMYSVDAHATFEYKPLLFSSTYGAPGQVHQQSLEKRPAVFSTLAGTEKDDNSYLGYSTIVGDFLGNGEEGIAVGMPRGNSLLGRVLLFTWNLTDYLHLSGDQMGSYFGYALAASDVDGDGKLDLIVGAPMYTVPSNKDQYDVGRVYVIYNKNASFQGIFNATHVIDGFNSKSRFGQAVASLGDINQDGYGDFAVGAPYDGRYHRGAVYIYHGSDKGVRNKYSQVIFAEDVGVPFPPKTLETFGFSITGGLDLDGNEYPDLAVGAYLSNKAFFFRSRPVVRVDAYVKFLTPSKEIDLEKPNLYLANDTTAVKTQIEFCSRFYGKGIPSSINLNLQYLLDSKKPLNPRMGFVDSEGSNIKNDTIKLYRSQTSYKCIDKPIDVYVRCNIRDKLTPLVAEVKYWMSPDQDLGTLTLSLQERDPRSILTPVLDLNSPPSKKDFVRIQTNCGKDNVCIPNLKLQVKSITPKYYFNSKEKIMLEIFVSNVGEESFETTLDVKYPESLYYGNSIDLRNDSHVLCSDYDSNHTVKCDIGNPLPYNKGVFFKLWWEPNYDYENHTTSYFFELFVNSTNPEEPSTYDDNKVNILIEVFSELHQEIYFKSLPQEVYFNSALYTADISGQWKNTSQDKRLPEDEIGPQVIHIYRLKNEGQITIKKTELFFLWPAYTLSGDDFFYLVEPPQFSGTEKMNIQCSPIPANYRDFEVIGNKNKSFWIRYRIDLDAALEHKEQVKTTPAPSADKVKSGPSGAPGTNDPWINKVSNKSHDISEALLARNAKRIEIFRSDNPNVAHAHRISNTSYFYRCLEAESGTEVQGDCGEEHYDMIKNITALVLQGKIKMSEFQRSCMAVINGELKPIPCSASKKVQIFRTSHGNDLRQRLGNTSYFCSCVERVNGVEREVKCGPEMAHTLDSIAKMVEDEIIYVGYTPKCMETRNGEWKQVDCDYQEAVTGGTVQIFRGQVGMVGEKYQLQRLGNSQYFYRCLHTINGQEKEVECGPEFSLIVSNVKRRLESGSKQDLNNRCAEEVDGQLKIVECRNELINLGRVDVFRGQGSGNYRRIGNTGYFIRCLRTIGGVEQEVECGPEFLSASTTIDRLVEEGNVHLLGNVRCMMKVNGKLTPVDCNKLDAGLSGRLEIFQGQNGFVGGKHQGQRINNTNYFYRCLHQTFNGKEVEIPCGPEFSAHIENMTKFIQEGNIYLLQGFEHKCMREQNGQLTQIDCKNFINGDGKSKFARIEIFQDQNGYLAGGNRLGKTNYYYRCLQTINGKEEQVDCEPEFSAAIAKLVERGNLFLSGTFKGKKCMRIENGNPVPIKCKDSANEELNQHDIKVQIFHADIGGDDYEGQRITNTDYFYRCTHTVQGREEQVDCGPKFLSTMADVAKMLANRDYDSRQCMEIVNGRLQPIDCPTISAHSHVATETYTCWIYTEDWQQVDCSSDQLFRTLSIDGKAIMHRRCQKTTGHQQPIDIDCKHFQLSHKLYTDSTIHNNQNRYGVDNGAALGTGGFRVQSLDLGNIGQQGSENDWYGRTKRQIFDSNVQPSINEIRNRFPCTSMKCEYVRCTVENLEYNKQVTIALRGRLNGRVLRNVSLSKPMNFSTMMAARVIESPVPEPLVLKNELLYREVTTVVKKMEAEIKPDFVPLWVVVLSAVAGTIILLLLVFLLYKIGFFKRNRPSSAPERQPLNRNGYHNGDEVL